VRGVSNAIHSATRPPTRRPTPKPPPKRAVAGHAVQSRVFAITHRSHTARNRATPSHRPSPGVPRRPLWRAFLGSFDRSAPVIGFPRSFVPRSTARGFPVQSWPVCPERDVVCEGSVAHGGLGGHFTQAPPTVLRTREGAGSCRPDRCAAPTHARDSRQARSHRCGLSAFVKKLGVPAREKCPRRPDPRFLLRCPLGSTYHGRGEGIVPRLAIAGGAISCRDCRTAAVGSLKRSSPAS